MDFFAFPQSRWRIVKFCKRCYTICQIVTYRRNDTIIAAPVSQRPSAVAPPLLPGNRRPGFPSCAPGGPGEARQGVALQVVERCFWIPVVRGQGLERGWPEGFCRASPVSGWAEPRSLGLCAGGDRGGPRPAARAHTEWGDPGGLFGPSALPAGTRRIVANRREYTVPKIELSRDRRCC